MREGLVAVVVPRVMFLLKVCPEDLLASVLPVELRVILDPPLPFAPLRPALVLVPTGLREREPFRIQVFTGVEARGVDVRVAFR